MNPNRILLSCLFATVTPCLSLAVRAQTAPSSPEPAASAKTQPPVGATTAPPRTATPSDEVVALSPFTVAVSSEEGYLATQTLNGTRLKTDIKDIGSALTIFTEQMMDDLGATSITDIMSFAPNTDPFIATTGDTSGNGNDFINVGNQQFVTRGGATAVVSQDFFASGIPNDRFNTESLTFTRGPNAILFGLGNASGAFVSSSKRAKPNQTATTAAYQIDHRGSFRLTLDHNQVLKKRYAAIRYSGVYDAAHTFRPPTESFSRRHYVTLTLQPFGSDRTTLRANYELGLINVPAVRPWPVYDAVSPYLAAGSPVIQTYANNATVPAKPNGTVNYVNTGLTSTQFSLGGIQIPTQTLNNQGQSAKPSFANGFAVNGNTLRSLVNEAIYPTFASNFGNTALRLNDYKTFSIFLEQRITDDLFLEVAYNKVDNDLVALNGLVGQNDYLYIDPNAKLPNGQPNPNVGKLYVEAGTTRIDNPNSVENIRATTSYTLDFTKSKKNWLTYLGRHQAAIFIEQSQTKSWSSNNALRNVTPLVSTGPTAAIGNAANAITFRYYMDPANGKIGTAGASQYLNFPVYYSGDAPPSGAGTGIITPGFYAQQGLNMSAGIVKTEALATQSFFWNNRIVVTNGIRRDDNTSWRGTPNDFASLQDANTFKARGTGINLRKYLPASRRERGGHTYTRGLVFHATPWVSLTYNTSNNFKVNDSNLSVYGDILPNPQGEGKDYGLKFELLDRKLFLELIYYTNSSDNAIEQVASGAYGDFKTSIDRTWSAIAAFTGDDKYNTYPYNSIGTTWQDSVSTTSKGWEASVTARPTRQWQMVVNGSLRSDNTTSLRGPFISAYLAEYLPVIKSHADWQDLTVPIVGGTVAQAVAGLENTLANFEKVRGSPSANFAAKWTLNMVQSYDLDPLLKGFSVGATMNARGKSVGGFAVDSANLLDVTKPYYTPAYANFGARLTYRRKLFHGRIDWTLQANVRNVFDKNTIYPLFIVDKRDGRNTPETAVFTLREPRTYQFTSTFKF